MGAAIWRIFLPLLLTLPAGAQTDQQIEAVQSEHFKHWGYVAVSWNPGWQPVSAEEATRLEGRLQSDPEDVAARIRLLNYYWRNGFRTQRVASVLWLIEHHPDSPILGLDLAWLFPGGRDPGIHYRGMWDAEDFAKARVLWEAVLPQYSNTPEALHNAARFFRQVDLARSTDLMERLRKNDPVRHAQAIDFYFSKVLSRTPGSPPAPQVR